MKLNAILISILCFLFLFNCNKDFSSQIYVESGTITLNQSQSFDFSHDRIIDFRYADELTNEQKKNAIDLLFYINIDTIIIRVMGPPLYVELQSSGFSLRPDSLNPSIMNLQASGISQISDLSNMIFLPDIIYTNIDSILNRPVFAVKTAESKYAILEIIDIDSNDDKISFKWKYQPDGSTNFKE